MYVSLSVKQNSDTYQAKMRNFGIKNMHYWTALKCVWQISCINGSSTVDKDITS